MRRALLVMMTALALSTPMAATAGDSILEQALAAYRRAQETSDPAERPAAFARAERLFAAAAEQRDASAALWTNVGTSALQAQHIGTAILAYRRALALDPDNRHARQNLDHARTLLPAWVPRPESGAFLDNLMAWQTAMSTAERRAAAALAFLAAGILLGAAMISGSTALRFFGLLPLLAWSALMASDLIGTRERAGVVAAAETVARAADSRNAPARFAEPLPPGTEVTIAEERGSWARVVLADGRDAWVVGTAVESVDSETAGR